MCYYSGVSSAIEGVLFMPSTPSRLELANAIRVLSMDAVQRANSGHPGMPMGMADIAEVLWNDHLKFNPDNPNWSNRDRFVLSNGHGAMLLYSVLHLTGYDLNIDDIKNFRQMHSKTPGHPEYADAPGVETTTGPLGQGLANAVGMALAEKMLAAQFNRDGHDIVDHHTYVFAGDGDLMEGISHEVCSLAGTWQLGKLVVLYDDNGISIDGDVSGWFTDDTPKRFEAYNWHVVPNVDGHDSAAINAAIEQARSVTDKPTLICCKTKIGFGAPTLEGSEKSHGAPLGDEEIAGARKALNWPHAPFVIPDDIYAGWNAREKGVDAEGQWNKRFAAYETAHPELAAEFLRRQGGYLPESWQEQCETLLQQAATSSSAQATRKSSLQCLNSLAPQLSELIGGSADLTGSNCTNWSGSTIFSADNNVQGNYIEYGVREFGMSAIMNGMALHRGFIPFSGTFLTFTDYARNAVRLSALMKQRVIYVYSHDSIGLGEDGPTHQPIEHASMLRLTPGVHVWRPADLMETAVAWQYALQHQGPSCLLLTRQNLPQQAHREGQENVIKCGGYVVYEGLNDGTTLEAIVLATGSEVHLAVNAAKLLAEEGVNIRVVSMPCCDLFKEQEQTYRDQVLPPDVTTRLAIEAGSPDYWYQFVGLQGRVIGMATFGHSAPADQLFKHFGFSEAHIKAEVLGMLHQQKVSSI